MGWAVENLETQLRRFIADNFFVEPDELDGSTSLMGSGTVDSTGILEIILHLEEAFGIKVPDEEALPRNLDSINNLIAYISSKQSPVPA